MFNLINSLYKITFLSSLTRIGTLFGHYSDNSDKNKIGVYVRDVRMKYTDFFSKFYMGRSSCGILGYKSKEKIPEFFMTAALKEAYCDRLPTSNDTYGKWFDGTRKPGNEIWSLVVSHFNKDGFIDTVSSALNDSELQMIMCRFGIVLRDGEAPDKRLFAYALAKQFYSIAQGNGNADDVAEKFYKPDAHIISFPEYAERTKAKYKKIGMPFSDGEERLLEDVYVCNILSSRLATTKNRHNRTQERIIQNATLDLIAEYSKKVILVANGGMGKSIMLQHLFLESINKHLQTGVLPIMIELRDFSENNDLYNDYIVKTVEIYDRQLTNKKIEDLMISGKCQILLDGADEIDPSDMKVFQRQIIELTDRYPYNQYIVASRECDIIKAVNGFSRMYLHPFNAEQSSTLINKLFTDSEDETICDEIIKYISGNYLQKHKVFASNPMLLTFVIMKYPIVDSFEGKKRLFYRAVYDAMVCCHDEEKRGYSRVFRSAQNAEEFTRVFREFCAITYIKHDIEFDFDTFDAYFKNLVTKNTLENPKIMTSKNFIHDACATACMMYEEDIKLLYIDPGFQEYLFAQHYFTAAPEELENLGHTLWNMVETEFDGYDAFEMLNEFSSEKFEKNLLVPYLHNIFKGKSDDASFISFISCGYKELEYQVIDPDVVDAYSKRYEEEWVTLKGIITEPANIIFSILLRRLNIPGLLYLSVYENLPNYPEFMTAGIFGEHYFEPQERKKKILPRRLLRQDIDDLQTYERTHVVENYVHDDNKNLVCFGYEYKIRFDNVLKSPETYSALINILKTPNEDAWKVYCKLKGHYEELIEKYVADS